tara:strand:- start:743 stop:955 length:213 start_codon:yes stop_codon:yes gene_type:complete
MVKKSKKYDSEPKNWLSLDEIGQFDLASIDRGSLHPTSPFSTDFYELWCDRLATEIKTLKRDKNDRKEKM